MDYTNVGIQPITLEGNPGAARCGGLSAGWLKIIAIIAMFIDHAAYAFVNDYYSPLGLALHCIGRITGPIMFYFVVEGYHHTRNKNRYTLRMGIFALISYLPFIYFISGGLPTQNNYLYFDVIYTLFLGLLLLRVQHEINSLALRAVLSVLLFVASTLGDWSYLALAFIWLFDVFRGDFRRQAIAYTVVALTQIMPTVANGVHGLLTGADPLGLYRHFAPAILYCGLFLPLLLLYFYNGKRGPGSKWLFYVFYPAHLLLIGFLKQLSSSGALARWLAACVGGGISL